MKIKIALVGCGRISANHFAALAELSDRYRLTAVCDIHEERLAAAEKTTGVTAFASLPEMLKHADADVLSICTPSGLHPAHGIEAAKAGLHVITEKPMAVRWNEGLKLVRTCEVLNRKLFVVKQNRFNPTLQALKTAVDSGRFGRISNITSNVFWTRPQEYYDQAKWRGTWALDGGAFMNQASHYVDLLTWIGGPLETVSAFTGTLRRKIEAEDCGVMALRFKSGAMGTLNVSMLTYPKNFEGSLTVIGERGLVRIGGIALNKLEAWQFSDETPDDATVSSASYETQSVYGFGHRLFYEEVRKALHGEPNQATTGRDGLVSLSTLVASYRSAKRGGQPMGFPLDM
jgi:UDP-N-acetyl-2-amino-2-deoxyglucuronate dehydrogenase